MRRIKLIHEDLSAGGGAERLTAASLEELKELDFSVDLVTFTKPNWTQLERVFELRDYVNNVKNPVLLTPQAMLRLDVRRLLQH